MSESDANTAIRIVTNIELLGGCVDVRSPMVYSIDCLGKINIKLLENIKNKP